MFAAMNGRVGAVNALLKNGARANDSSSTGQTSLMYAAWKGRTRAILALLAAGAEVNARAEDGQTFDAAIPPFTLSVPRTLH